MRRACILLPLLVALAPMPAVAQAVSAPAADAAAAEKRALTDRLMATAPKSSKQNDMLAAGDKEHAAFLAAHPDKAAALDPVYAAFGQCVRTGIDMGQTKVVRDVAQRMKVADLTKLVLFLESPEYTRLAALGERKDAGGTLTREEEAELEAVGKRPEMQAFLGSMMEAMMKAMFSGTLPKDRDCTAEKTRALAAINLAPPEEKP